MPRNPYKFCEKDERFKTRHKYQNATAQWVCDRLINNKDQKGVLLCDPVGNGKTWEAMLAAINLAHHSNGFKRILILTKKSELIHKWSSEFEKDDILKSMMPKENSQFPSPFHKIDTSKYIFKEFPNLNGKDFKRYCLVVNSKSRCREMFECKKPKKGVWIMSNHAISLIYNENKRIEGLNKIEHLHNFFDLIIYDECHHAKKRNNSQTFQNFIKLRQNNPRAFVLGLTATPIGTVTEDLSFLIETVCLPISKFQEGRGVNTELLSLNNDMNDWKKQDSFNKRSGKKKLEKKLSQFLVRTPNVRKREYYFGCGREEVSIGKGALPIPCPFTDRMDGIEESMLPKDLSPDEMRHLVNVHVGLRTSTEKMGFSNVYKFVSSGFEPIDKLLKTQSKKFKFERKICESLYMKWLENSREIHPKTRRLIEYSQKHFDIEDPNWLNSRGKLLIFCELKSVVKTPPLENIKPYRKEVRKALIDKLGLKGSKYIGETLGKGDSAAKLSRIIRSFFPDLVKKKDKNIKKTDFLSALKSLNKEESWDILVSDKGGIGYSDALTIDLDNKRNSILRKILGLNGKNDAELHKYYKKDLEDYLFKLAKKEDLESPWFRFELTENKKSLNKDSMGKIFVENHSMLFEAYRQYLVCRGKKGKQTFYRILWSLVLSLKDYFTSKGKEKMFSPNAVGENKINPFLKPYNPIVPLTGDVSLGVVRNRLIELFKLPMNPMTLFCTEIGTEGIDLHTFCFDVIHYTLSWVPLDLEQKTGRIDRDRIIPEQLKEVFKNDPRYKTEEVANKSRVHFMVLPRSYDERMLYRVNKRASDERSILASSDEEYKGSEKDQVCMSLDLTPKKKAA